MCQEKIGKFISSCRKDKKLTQEQLADKLGVSNRAVSKWERGLNMPDSSIMLELCNILDISVNELLSGEVLKNDGYIKKAEENLTSLKNMEEKYNKTLLMMEVIIVSTCIAVFIILILVIGIFNLSLTPSIILATTAILLLLLGIVFSMKFEREAGYYKCKNCNYKYIPNKLAFFSSIHIGRSRYLTCPQCGVKTLNKKVLTKQ